jgi:hypothetical protein
MLRQASEQVEQQRRPVHLRSGAHSARAEKRGQARSASGSELISPFAIFTAARPLFPASRLASAALIIFATMRVCPRYA